MACGWLKQLRVLQVHNISLCWQTGAGAVSLASVLSCSNPDREVNFTLCFVNRE